MKSRESENGRAAKISSFTYRENTQNKLFGPIDTEEDKNRFMRKDQILKEEHEKKKNIIMSKYE